MKCQFRVNLMFLKKLPNNYDIALKRTLSMRRTAAKKLAVERDLTDTFAELLKHDWIVPADKNENDSYKKWYLPFFVAKTAKLELSIMALLQLVANH